MNYLNRINRLFEKLEDNSILLLYSGIPVNVSEDDYYWFKSNRHFYYLTGLDRDHMALLLKKNNKENTISLYIQKPDPNKIRWTGKMLSVEEAKVISGISDIKFIADLDNDLSGIINYGRISYAYFDLFRRNVEDIDNYNIYKSKSFSALYPQIIIKDFHDYVSELRTVKENEEVDLVRKAIDITNKGLRSVLRYLKPNCYEYQVQAVFESSIMINGADSTSFPTIAGSGSNGTMLHYETNKEKCCGGDLLLLDLGVRYKGYCSDVTRTFPINGKYTDRQKQIYNIVLAANKKIARSARPGITTKELNEICKQELADGLINVGLISSKDEIGKYYMHGVSHHIGIDVHDSNSPLFAPLKPGCIISNEPGLYIDEEGIGIRIEDDLLITDTGCEVLTREIPKETEEIEYLMSER